jgi:hypothetical protein
MKSSKILILFYCTIIFLQVAENQASIEPKEQKLYKSVIEIRKEDYLSSVNYNIMHVILEYLDSYSVLCGLVKTNNTVREKITNIYPNSSLFFIDNKTILLKNLSLPNIAELDNKYFFLSFLLQRPILTKKSPYIYHELIDCAFWNGFQVTRNFSLVRNGWIPDFSFEKSNKWKLIKSNFIGNLMFYNFRTRSLLIYRKGYQKLYETKCPMFFQFLFPDSDTFFDKTYCRIDDLLSFYPFFSISDCIEKISLIMNFPNKTTFNLSFTKLALHKDNNFEIYQFTLPIHTTNLKYQYLATVKSSGLKLKIKGM